MSNNSEQKSRLTKIAVILIFSLFSAILMFRGVHIFFTGRYLSTTRLGTIIDLHGIPAYLNGAAYILLGLSIGLVTIIQAGRNHTFIKFCAALCLVLAAACFTFSVTVKN